MAEPLQSSKLGAPVASSVWAVYTLLLQLSLDCCWHVNGRDLPPLHWLGRRPWPLWSICCIGADPMEYNNTTVGFRHLPSPPLECVTCGGDWVMLQSSLKLSTRFLALGPPGTYRPRSAITCFLPGIPSISYNMTCIWLLLAFGLEVPGGTNLWTRASCY